MWSRSFYHFKSQIELNEHFLHFPSTTLWISSISEKISIYLDSVLTSYYRRGGECPGLLHHCAPGKLLCGGRWRLQRVGVSFSTTTTENSHLHHEGPHTPSSPNPNTNFLFLLSCASYKLYLFCLLLYLVLFIFIQYWFFKIFILIFLFNNSVFPNSYKANTGGTWRQSFVPSHVNMMEWQ